MAELWLHGFPVIGASAPLARRAEAAGYDGLLLADSQALQGDVYVGLALAAAATSTIRLGTGVTNPVTRHPTVTASAIATVHAESGGRATLGIGRGDSSVTQIGRRAASPEELEAHVRTVRALLRGERTDAGRLSWLDPSLPAVDVHVAATGPKTIAAAARSADAVLLTVGAEPERLRAALASARAAGARRVGAYVNVACAEDPADARALVRGSAAIFAHFSSQTMAGVLPDDHDVIEHIGQDYDDSRHGQSVARHATELPDGFLDRFAVVGAPEIVRDRLAGLIALGLDPLVLVPGSKDADPGLLARSDALVAELLDDVR
ncbi:MAG TPA: LLM class flavin-dependent oxidoreductase [Capillimicrobium sp.]